jgi:radical SAM superfamily enzyme YgiQ (UPF0313 family)
MKILFVCPPQLNAIDLSLPKILQEKEDPMPPLGLLYVASYLQKQQPQHELKFIDCELQKINHEELKKIIATEKPDVVAMSAMTFSMPTIILATETVKTTNPNTKVVLGGPHVYIYPKETLSHKNIDFLILGEGEIAFSELIANLNNPEKYSEIKNLAYRKDSEVIINPMADAILDLDSLPMPNRELLSYKNYRSALAEKSIITTMITSRGCPFRCIFCNRPHLGKRFRFRSAKNVVQEMEECYRLGIGEIFIYDDTFTVNRQRVVDICNMLIEKNLGLLWDIRARVDTVDYELLKLLKQAGCVRIHFGVEAGTQKIMNSLRKDITLEKAETAFKMSRKLGIKTLAYFMIGSPEETREDILETIRFAKKIDPDFGHFSITSPFPATELYQIGLDKGILPNDYWLEFAKNPTLDFKPMVWEENLNHQELIKLLEKAYSSFYWRPKYIIRTFRNIRSLDELFRKAGAAIKILKI